MLKFFRRKSNLPTTPNSPEPASDNKSSWFSRLKNSLSRTRSSLSEGLANLFLGKKEINTELLDEIETHLLAADIGIQTSEYIINTLTQRINRQELKDVDMVNQALRQTLLDILLPVQQPLSTENHCPFVILMIGVNGAGKTTTIGKLAQCFVEEKRSVLLAAGDTFRAAAIEQLQAWGQRTNIPVIAQQMGADSASVIFDAFQAAQARKIDILIADTAGRLHTQDNLMEELKKVKRVMSKLDDKAPHEILLVIDASQGQNALNQAIKFHEALNVTGIVLTKLDGSAKGGIIFAIAHQLKLPIRFIGTGEQLDDLQVFDAKEFITALFDEA